MARKFDERLLEHALRLIGAQNGGVLAQTGKEAVGIGGIGAICHGLGLGLRDKAGEITATGRLRKGGGGKGEGRKGGG